MGLFDTLFGGEESSISRSRTKQKTEQTQEAVKTGISQTTATKEGTESTTGQQTGATTQQLFSEADLSILSQLTERLNTQLGSGFFGPEAEEQQQNLAQIAETLQARLTGDGGIDDIVAKAQTAATASFREQAGDVLGPFAQQIGSAKNTAVADLRARSSRDLAAQLGGIEAGIRLQGSQLFTDLGRAASSASVAAGEGRRTIDRGQTEALQNLLNVLTVSRGGVTTGTTQQDASSSTVNQQISDILQTTSEEEFIKILLDSLTKSRGTASGTSRAPLLGQISSAFQEFGLDLDPAPDALG